MAGITSKESPFSPGKPVPVEYFIARFEELERLKRAVKQTLSGRNENIFITGERGIGKSSLGGFIRWLAGKEYDFIGAHCFLGGVRDLETMIRVIFQKLLQEVSDKNIFDNLKNIFGNYITGLTLFGVGVEFTKDRSELRTILDNFLPVIRNINETIKENKKGIILILDDLNGITDIPEFAQFLKSFVDELATSQEFLPLLLILVGLPERREEMIKHQPSVARIFDIVSLSPMNVNESKEFFNNMFGKQDISVTPEALSLMVRLSGGFPMLMHEVGDKVFWLDEDDLIDEDDAKSGIVEAAETVGKKYLDSQVYRALRSDIYRSILRRIGKLTLGTRFRRKDILEKVPEKEQKTLDNFLRRIKKLGIISETEIWGEYEFINQLYHLYVMIEAFSAEKEKKRPNKR
ncbi:MAG: ATP-binding protein [Deltaproteobacteria bacterium]|nr:MAG: ATP-binding protein [Deltaproteobacteria bacterium]